MCVGSIGCNYRQVGKSGAFSPPLATFSQAGVDIIITGEHAGHCKGTLQKPALYSKPGSITSMMNAIATNFGVSALAGRWTLHACIGIVHQLLLALQSLHKDDLEGFQIDMQHILLCTGSHREGPVVAFLPSKLSWQLSHFKDAHIVTCGVEGGERTTAPEVRAGGARNRASDLFAVGCVFLCSYPAGSHNGTRAMLYRSRNLRNCWRQNRTTSPHRRVPT
jgi:hypothetical protein